MCEPVLVLRRKLKAWHIQGTGTGNNRACPRTASPSLTSEFPQVACARPRQVTLFIHSKVRSILLSLLLFDALEVVVVVVVVVDIVVFDLFRSRQTRQKAPKRNNHFHEREKASRHTHTDTHSEEKLVTTCGQQIAEVS